MNNRQSLFNNAQTSVGLVPRLVHSEFDKEEKKIQHFESTNKKFYKDVKYYADKLDDLIKSETKLINNLSNLSSTTVQTDFNNEFIEKITKWKQVLNDHQKSAENLKQTCQSNVIEPMKKLSLIFPQIYQAIKRREQSLKELLKQQEKLDKLQDKERTGPNLVRLNELQQSVNLAKQQFEKEHLFLMEELPKLYNTRVDYIKPCVNSFINSQLKFYEDYSNFYDSINQQEEGQESYVNLSSNQSEIDNLNDEIQKCLLDIKSLSIVASD